MLRTVGGLVDAIPDRIASVHLPVDLAVASNDALGTPGAAYIWSGANGDIRTTTCKGLSSVQRVDGVRVDGAIGQIFRDSEMIVPGLSAVESPYTTLRNSPRARFQVFGRVIGEVTPEPIRDVDEAAFAITRWPGTWYHFVLETLGSLIELVDAGLTESLPILVDSRAIATPSMLEAMTSIAPGADFIPVGPNEIVSVGRLWVPAPPTTHMPSIARRGPGWNGLAVPGYNPDVLGRLRRAVRTLVEPPSDKESPGGILLERPLELSDPRPIHRDQQALLVQRLGLEPVEPASLTFIDQVGLFSRINLVVGATGSAWVNLLFCPSGARGIVITAPERTSPMVWAPLARIAGVELDILPGRWFVDWRRRVRALRADSHALARSIERSI